MYMGKGPFREYAKLVKDIVNIPVLMAGRMDDPEMASECIENGTCDMISLGRPLLADPDYVNKLRTGRTAEIRPCISCQEGCMGRLQHYSMINCAVNPQSARERVTAYEPITKPKRVMIVGGGVAGGAPDFKEDDILLANWYENELKRLSVPVKLNTVVVVGGGLVGCETALWLAQAGKKATIVEVLPKIMAVKR